MKKNQISFGQYRAVDLGILTAVLLLSEWVISLASFRWYPEQLYVASPAAAMIALVMMRWNGWAAIPAVLGGSAYSLLHGGGAEHVLIYCLGNLAGLLGLPILSLSGKKRIRENTILTLLFGLAVQLLMQMGRGLTAAVLGYPMTACLGFFTTDTLSELFTFVILFSVRQADGLFEDQKTYLLRTQSEPQDERREWK